MFMMSNETMIAARACESVADCVREKWGETVWLTLVGQAGIGWGGFSIHKVYSELLIERVAQTLSKIVFLGEDEIMFHFGAHFMTFVGSYGYDQVTKVLGRKLCDFINGLDNLHDYISNLYKEIRPPSFYVEKEDDRGLTFHYHTPRKYPAFVHYVRGVVTMAARIHYKMADCSVAVVKEELLDGGMHAIFRVTYANDIVDVQGPWMPVLRKLREETPVTVCSDVVFNSFPFSIIFSESMEVLSCGAGVVKSFPTLVGKKITDFFVLTKPFGIPFTWEFMRNRPLNVLLEMTSTVALWAEYEEYLRSQEIMDPENPPSPPNRKDSPPLKLRGTTAYLKSWNSVIFMCTPVFESLDMMNDIGLYISDLSFQDSVQVLLVAGPQQSAELKIALDMEQAKNSKLEETLGELDKENKKTDALLFSMIPREIAERLKKGESPINIAEAFSEVTVLFSDIVGFTNICTRISPMEVVAILNQIYTVFDTLSGRYEVFKVETIGDGYMAVSGAPVRTKLHAQHICDMALEMQAGIRHLKDPWTGAPIRIRIGIHSGGVVAGVVGQKMIRYCLFGDTVNTASRMESSGEGCEIHISKTVRDRLVVTGAYKIEDRGMIYIKGKGQMRTYWLKGRNIIKDNGPGLEENSCIQNPADQTEQPNEINILQPVLDIVPIDTNDITTVADVVKSDTPPTRKKNLKKVTQLVLTDKPTYNTSKKHQNNYDDENSMSFRQALEEIVDLQTKEMVAYQEVHASPRSDIKNAPEVKSPGLAVESKFSATPQTVAGTHHVENRIERLTPKSVVAPISPASSTSSFENKTKFSSQRAIHILAERKKIEPKPIPRPAKVVDSDGYKRLNLKDDVQHKVYSPVLPRSPIESPNKGGERAGFGSKKTDQNEQTDALVAMNILASRKYGINAPDKTKHITGDFDSGRSSSYRDVSIINEPRRRGEKIADVSGNWAQPYKIPKKKDADKNRKNTEQCAVVATTQQSSICAIC